MRDRIMRRYDQELLGAPLWCTTQQEEGLCIQGVNVMVPQRRVFVCASELALDESLSHRHMGAVYDRSSWRVGLFQCSHSLKGARQVRGQSRVNEGSFEAHVSYLRDAFDGVTKVIQLAEAKLGSGYLSTGQEDAEAGSLEEYRRVFRVYASKLASDESLGHQHMGAVYHRGSSQITSTSESHGGDLIIL
ncbi:hypothetical protein BHE74_00037287, partial [Ensete ventricosum]